MDQAKARTGHPRHPFPWPGASTAHTWSTKKCSSCPNPAPCYSWMTMLYCASSFADPSSTCRPIGLCDKQPAARRHCDSSKRENRSISSLSTCTWPASKSSCSGRRPLSSCVHEASIVASADYPPTTRRRNFWRRGRTHFHSSHSPARSPHCRMSCVVCFSAAPSHQQTRIRVVQQRPWHHYDSIFGRGKLLQLLVCITT
mmetsp:Transcript_10089/g.28744  ORF Transcript_10089/g.28744 Transcript_10089/m.28744 type:complete len:200 (+) Transcript_10089:2663-3262(+)